MSLRSFLRIFMLFCLTSLVCLAAKFFFNWIYTVFDTAFNVTVTVIGDHDITRAFVTKIIGFSFCTDKHLLTPHFNSVQYYPVFMGRATPSKWCLELLAHTTCR